MNTAAFNINSTSSILSKDIITTADFFALMPDVPRPTVYTRINKLIRDNVIYKVGKGLYRKGKANGFTQVVSPAAKKIYTSIGGEFPYISICVWDMSGLNSILHHLINFNITIVDVDRDAVESVYWHLKETGYQVITTKRMFDNLSDYADYVLVRPLITEAPTQKTGNIVTASIEKILVDLAHDKEFAMFQGYEIFRIFENAFEQYGINQSKMMRYARRRGCATEIGEIINQINRQ